MYVLAPLGKTLQRTRAAAPSGTPLWIQTAHARSLRSPRLSWTEQLAGEKQLESKPGIAWRKVSFVLPSELFWPPNPAFSRAD